MTRSVLDPLAAIFPGAPVRLRPVLVPALLALALLGCERKQAPATPAPDRPSSSAAQPGTGPLVVGMIGALTGPEAHFGSESRNGAQMAVEEANAAGGVQGRQLLLRSYDSQSRPEEAANAMTRLVNQDRALFVVGENQSSLSLAMAPEAAKGEVPMIAPSSTNPRVTTEGGPYVFRVCFTDTFQGQLLARYARETLKAERVAILVDQKSDYAVGLAKVFATRFGALGGKIVAEQAYAKGDSDFRSQLTRTKAAKPEVLFIPGYYSDVGPMARQARELGMRATLLGGDGWDSGERLGQLAGAAVEGAMYSTHFAPDNPGGRVQEFIARYRARFGHVPDALGALGYDAARVGIDALRRSSGVGGPALREQIARTRDFDGITGRITLGPDRDAVKPAIIVKLVKGQPVFTAEVSP